jgi:hypothetical protein
MDAAAPAASSSATAAPPPSSPPGDGGLDPDPGPSLLSPAAPALMPPAPAARAPAPAAQTQAALTPAAPGVPAAGVLEPPIVGMEASGARPEDSTMPSLCRLLLPRYLPASRHRCSGRLPLLRRLWARSWAGSK